MEKGRKSLRVALYLTFQKLALIVKPQMLRYKLLSRAHRKLCKLFVDKLDIAYAATFYIQSDYVIKALNQ